MTENILDVEEKVDVNKERLKLLPKWIKFFSWIFLVLGATTPIILFLPLVYNGPLELSVLGFSADNPYHPQGIAVVLFFLLSGLTAFGLLWAKKWAPLLGFLISIIGLICVIINAIYSQDNNLPLEPLLQIPFMIKMISIKGSWEWLGEE